MSLFESERPRADRRRAWALALLPGLALAALYALGFRAERVRALRTLETSVAAALGASPSPGFEDAQRARLAELDAEIARLEANVLDAAQAGARGASTPAASADRARRVAAMLAQHRWVLVEERSGSEDGVALPAAAARGLGLDLPGALEVRTVEFDAEYLDVLSALERLVGPAMGVVPLRLALEQRRADGPPRWTLVWA